MDNTRRQLGFGLVAASCWLISGASAHAQSGYPERPVRIVVGFAAGTGPDMVARLLAQRLSAQWGGVGVVVDNKPAAGGTVAAAEVARSKPDGYTLLLAATGQLSIAPSTYSQLPYNPAKDFTPISNVAESEFVLLVNPQKVPAKNGPEFVRWGKGQKPLFMATFGAGTAGHFGAYILGDELGVKPEVVHYRATADALGGLYNGDVQGVFASVGLAAAQVKSQKLLALGSTGSTRAHTLPDVPTFKEQGLPQLGFTTWFGIVGPAGLPGKVAQKLNADVLGALHTAETRQKIADAGFKALGTSPEQFRLTIDADTRLWAKAVAATGFKADQ
ncbi:MAG: hypothetical protein RJA09_1563 [Pseudomonadota bacterium]